MSRIDPDTTPIGRQPSHIMVTPSKAGSPWYGAIKGCVRERLAFTGGDRFTEQQKAALISRGMDVLTTPTMVVKRQADAKELWWPDSELPPVFAFECPMVGETADRIRVIAPSGVVKLVLPTGWAHHPYRDPFKLQLRIRGGVL